MKIAGIIAEYNPFHKGHQYQIREIKNQGYDYVITVISGDFVQRGAPAIADKYTRARMALLGGADLVLELPAVYATASAETFAAGGVRSLAATGLADAVSFGMEQPEPALLKCLADLLVQEPDWYRKKLREGLRKGLSYPAARSRALPEYADFLASPNNILALEYAKAVQTYAPRMTLLPIQRQGSGYHHPRLTEDFSSAGAIRSLIRKETSDYAFAKRNIRSCSEQLFSIASPLAWALPESTLSLLSDYQKHGAFLYEDDLSLPLHCCLIGQTLESLTCCCDISPALARRILALRNDFTSFTGFCEALKTKDQTYVRISRALLHLLLGITDELMDQAGQLPYLRVLGFRRPAASLLGQIQQKGRLPLITSPAKVCGKKDSGARPDITGSSGPAASAPETQTTAGASGQAALTQEARALLQTDLRAHDLYRALLTARTGRAWPGEFRQRMLVVD